MAESDFAAVLQMFNQLSAAEQDKLLRKLLPELPKGRGLTAVWLITLGILGVAIFFFGWLGYQQLKSGRDGGEVLFGLASTC